MAGRTAIVGLDGATFRLLDPLCAAGVMPALSGLRARGAEAILRSTVPAYTPPAWVSMATGVNPGRHGVFGFLETTPQEPARIVHSGSIDSPPLWRYLNEQGVEAGVFNVPITYPPTAVSGFLVSGGLAAGWTDPEMPNFASDEEAARLVTRAVGGPYPLDTVVSYENDWRSAETATRIEHVQRMRRRGLAALLEHRDPHVVFAVFEGPDRLQHVHYQYLVECSEWYGRPEASRVRDRASAYFRELDHAVQDLANWAGRDGHVIVVSDHGAGPWEKTVNVNLLLDQWGYLAGPAIGRLAGFGPIAGPGQRLARKVIPRKTLHRLKARVQRGMDWQRTTAFSSHVAEQGIHVNERGVLPFGVVDAAQAQAVAAELAERLHELRDPGDGQPVVDRVIARSEAMAGPHFARAPHLFPMARDQRYELSDTLAASSPFTDHRDRPWGYHHSDGVFIAAGPGVAPGTFAPGLDIVDVLPTVFHLAGLAVPAGLDGTVVGGLLGDFASGRPVAVVDSEISHHRTREYPFSAGEEAEIEESLRGLGYIE